jgi:DNA-binding winged helix-turn-helix (wHTH) protein
VASGTSGNDGAASPRRILRFGAFELDTRSGELRKHGNRIRLQGKPLQVLQALLDRPGEVVSRDELQRRLWSSDVFVDFDNGLNTAANRVRAALGDTAESPRYIETLARSGYLYRFADNSTVRLGQGRAMALSGDGRWALTLGTRERTRFRLMPLAGGRAKELPPTGLDYQWARFFPDNERLLALASEPGRPLRLYVQSLHGNPKPISPPMVVRNVAIPSDGSRIAVLKGDGQLIAYSTAGADPVQLSPIRMLGPLLWNEEWLYVQEVGAYTQIPTQVSRLHVRTGKLEPRLSVAPSDTLGVNAITKVMLSADASTCVYNFRRVLSELFVAEPVR